MKPTTKNIDKVIRNLRKAIASDPTKGVMRCLKCNKYIRLDKWLAMINGFGGLNYYHDKCLFDKLEKDAP